MTIDIAVTPGAGSSSTVVAIKGDIDLQTAPKLEPILSGLHENVIIDLTDTVFMDSTALGLFVGLDNRLRPNGYTLSFICPNPRLQKIFRITRLYDLWTISTE